MIILSARKYIDCTFYLYYRYYELHYLCPTPSHWFMLETPSSPKTNNAKQDLGGGFFISRLTLCDIIFSLQGLALRFEGLWRFAGIRV